MLVDSRFLDVPVEFQSGENLLQGVLSKPQGDFNQAVIIVVGGPQFRVGSHRQFVLLARYLASQGVLVLRFDYTGMGYSSGRPKQFFEVDHDIHAATSYVFARYPHLTNMYLWGLCDAASAISFTAYTDSRLSGIIISNPWVRSEASHSEAILKNYYRDRIVSWDVWRDLFASPKKILKAIVSLTSVSAKVLLNIFSNKSPSNKAVKEITLADRQNNLVASVFTGMSRFQGQICLIISGKDLTADEFMREFDNSGWLNEAHNAKKITVHTLDDADHTFSSAAWRAEVEKITMEFISG